MIEEIDATFSKLDSVCLSQIQPDVGVRFIDADIGWL